MKLLLAWIVVLVLFILIAVIKDERQGKPGTATATGRNSVAISGDGSFAATDENGKPLTRAEWGARGGFARRKQ